MLRTPGTYLSDGTCVFTDQGVILCHNVAGRKHKDQERTYQEAVATARLLSASDVGEKLAQAVVNGEPGHVILRLAAQFLAKARLTPSPVPTEGVANVGA